MQRNISNERNMLINSICSSSLISAFMLIFLFPNFALAQNPSGRVLTVTQETFTHKTKPQVCWKTILTEEQKATREKQSTPWLTRYWQPLLGAAMGAPIAYSLTGNYGIDSQKWIWPTVAGGAAAGAIAGPGFTAGSYGLGTLAYAIWPASLPLTVGLSLVGGILGDVLWKMIFPPKKVPEKVTPGEYMTNQVFFIETTCTRQPKITYSESGYLVKYLYKGQTETARVKYYPGQQILLTLSGRPIDELMPPLTSTQK